MLLKRRCRLHNERVRFATTNILKTKKALEIICKDHRNKMSTRSSKGVVSIYKWVIRLSSRFMTMLNDGSLCITHFKEMNAYMKDVHDDMETSDDNSSILAVCSCQNQIYLNGEDARVDDSATLLHEFAHITRSMCDKHVFHWLKTGFCEEDLFIREENLAAIVDEVVEKRNLDLNIIQSSKSRLVRNYNIKKKGKKLLSKISLDSVLKLMKKS